MGCKNRFQVVSIFKQKKKSATINSSTFELSGKGDKNVPATVSYDAVLRKATLTPLAPLKNSTIYKAVIMGGKNGVKDQAGNKMKDDYIWSFTTVDAPDLTPPTIKSTDPANGQTGVALNSVVSAKFSEDMNGGTINGTTFELRNGAGQLVTGTVIYQASSNKAVLTPSAPLSNSVVYTAIIKGGSAGVKDAAGNPLTADYSWSFSTPYTIFQSTDIPATPVTTDQPVE